MWREITIPPDCDRRPLDLVVHRRKLDPAEVTECERIPVTAPFRTLLDLASYLRPREVEAAVNEAVKLDLVELETMRRALDDLPPRAGKRLLAKLIHAPEFRLTDSELERRFLRLIARAGLVAPDTGVELGGFKTDFSWEDLRLVVETDGLRFHRSPSQQARDRVRDQTLTAAGFTVLRFTHPQVRYEPARVLATLKTVATRLHEHRLGD